MQGIAVLAGLVAVGYGFGAAGLLGALTGFVAAVGIGSGLAIALAETGTAVAESGFKRIAQRLGGIPAAVGCLAGAWYGGWHWGWLWAIGGYAAGAAMVLLPAIAISLGARSSRPGPDSVPEGIPEDFDLDDPVHMALIDDIRTKYGELLGDETHPYAKCLYRPASLLPYPKEVIERALSTLCDLVEGRRSSDLLDPAIHQPEFADTIKSTLIHLDGFLEVPADCLPTDSMENMRVGHRLQREILSNVVDGAGQAARCSISSPSLNFFPSKTWTISSEPLSLRQRTSA